MKKSILYLIVLFMSLLSLRSQNTFFTKTYGDYYTNVGVDVAELSKNQFLVLGNSSIQDYTYNPVLFLVGDTGQIIKKSEFFFPSIYKAQSLFVGASAFYISGITNDNSNNDYDAFVMKVDTLFNKVWVKTFGLPNTWDEAVSLTEVSGRLFVAINSYEVENLDMMASIVEFTSDGDSVNRFIISDIFSTEIKKMKSFSDSILTFSGSFSENSDSAHTAIIGTLNLNTEYLSFRNYRAVLGESVAHSFCQRESGYAICGTTKKFFDFSNSDGYVLLIDDSMNYVFDMIVTDANYNLADEYLDIVKDHEDNFMVVGRTESIGAGNSDVLLFKFNPGAWFLWATTIGNDNYDAGNSLISTQDSSYLAIGETILNGVNNQDILLIKVSKEMQVDYSFQHVTKISEMGNHINFRYSNPVSENFNIYFEEPLTVEKISIFGTDGRIVYEEIINSQVQHFGTNLFLLRQGIYFFVLETKERKLTGKILKM
jgi:hypothetical protein